MRFLFISAFFSLFFSSFAQKGILIGKVYDEKERIPLPNLTVLLEKPGAVPGLKSEAISLTSEDGSFRFEHLPGNYVIYCLAAGYQEYREEIVLEKDSTIFLDVFL